MVLCLVAPVKRLSVHHHSVDCIFWSFGMIELIVNHFENRVPLKPVLGAWLLLYISLLVMNRLSKSEFST